MACDASGEAVDELELKTAVSEVMRPFLAWRGLCVVALVKEQPQ